MFGDFEGLEQITLSEELQNKGALECWIELRTYDWYITYIIYEDKVTVQESMGEVDEHSFEICETIEEAMYIASQWC